MKIGNFTKTNDGDFTGQLQTLTVSQNIMFIKVQDKGNDKSPDYKIVVDGSFQEIGAGWNHIGKDTGNPYIKTKLDDPSFPYTLWGALTANDDEGYTLYWSRPNAKNSKSQNAKTEKL